MGSPFKVQGILDRYDARVWVPPLKGAKGMFILKGMSNYDV